MMHGWQSESTDGPKRGSQQGSQAKFPGKVTRNRFPPEKGTPGGMFSGRGSRQGKWFQARFPGTGSQARVPRQEFPARGSQAKARFSRKGSQARVPRKSFPGTGSQARFPGTGFASTDFRNGFQGFQEPFPRKDFQEHVFPKRNKVPRTCFQSSVSRKRLPGRAVQARFPASFPSKISRIMFFQAKQSSQNRFSKKCFQEEVPGRSVQARFPASWFPSNVSRKKFPSKAPSHRFPGTGAHTRW